jgi:hypothetical protein
MLLGTDILTASKALLMVMIMTGVFIATRFSPK